MKGGKRPLIVGIIILAFAVSAWIAGQRRDFVQQEIENVQKLTIPFAGKLLHGPELVTERYAVRASWEFEVAWKWDDYRRWVEHGLGAHWKEVGSGESMLSFRRQLPDDFLELRIESISDGPPMRIRESFTGGPD